LRSLLGVSWGRARRWIASGKVRVSGAVVTDPTARVAEGDLVTLDERAPRPRPAVLRDEQVVFVDAQVIVIDKPAGLSTIAYEDAEPDNLEERVLSWLEHRARGDRGGRPSLGVVHRLDKETSGLLVFTRTWGAKQDLALQFRAHSVHRRYLAIASGDVRTQTLETDLVEDRGDGRRGSARGRGKPPAGSRHAVTHVERLEGLRGATLVGCRLETGRTHQIRIHLGEAGHPILGERVYGPRAGDDRAGAGIAVPRLMLHAGELGFRHPGTGRPVRWERDAPEDFQAVLRELGER
jgi:23S rRNA pseudouridine1911/1915/1917 synthase